MSEPLSRFDLDFGEDRMGTYTSREQERIAELERQLAKAKKVITDMPCHVWHTDGQEHLCAACQGREAIDAARKERK